MADAMRAGLGTEEPLAHVVHQETTLDDAMGIRRHVTVLAVTPTRLVVCHTDEHRPSELAPYPHATTTTEVVPALPGGLGGGDDDGRQADGVRARVACREATLVVGWGAIGQVDLEPAILRRRDVRGRPRLHRQASLPTSCCSPSESSSRPTRRTRAHC